MMNTFDFWFVRAVAGRKASLVKAGVEKSRIEKKRIGWASYGSKSYPRYRYEAVVAYVDAPMGREALNEAVAQWEGKGVELLVNYHCSD
jgi:hypothetical protein